MSTILSGVLRTLSEEDDDELGGPTAAADALPKSFLGKESKDTEPGAAHEKGPLPRRFMLNRKEDETGISGTGYVAVGMLLPNGKAVLSWTTETSSVTIFDSIKDLQAVHGHDGKTEVEWIDAEGGEPTEHEPPKKDEPDDEDWDDDEDEGGFSGDDDDEEDWDGDEAA